MRVISATSAGLEEDVDTILDTIAEVGLGLPDVTFEVAASVNEVARDVEASISGSEILAQDGDVTVEAFNEMQLIAVTEVMAISNNSDLDLTAPNIGLSFGGVLASNEMRGDVLAFIAASGVRAMGTGADVKVRAANTYRFSWPDDDSNQPFPYKDDDE